MESIERDILIFLKDLYESSNVEYFDNAIYVSDEDNGRGYKIIVEETN